MLIPWHSRISCSSMIHFIPYQLVHNLCWLTLVFLWFKESSEFYITFIIIIIISVGLSIFSSLVNQRKLPCKLYYKQSTLIYWEFYLLWCLAFYIIIVYRKEGNVYKKQIILTVVCCSCNVIEALQFYFSWNIMQSNEVEPGKEWMGEHSKVHNVVVK